MKKNNKKGFTLVELVIVIAVMAALVAVAIPTVGAITGSANTAVEKSNARTIESMIKLAEAEASKNSDGVITVSEKQVADALAEAKLGIDAGKVYNYNIDTGVVASGSATAAKNLYVITFKADSVEVKGDETVTTPFVPAATEPKVDG